MLNVFAQQGAAGAGTRRNTRMQTKHTATKNDENWPSMQYRLELQQAQTRNSPREHESCVHLRDGSAARGQARSRRLVVLLHLGLACKTKPRQNAPRSIALQTNVPTETTSYNSTLWDVTGLQ
jgi:hypothetical protein